MKIRERGKKPGLLARVKHGLYCDYTRLEIDGRTRLGKARNRIRDALLAPFPAPAPAPAQVIADRCALKLIRAASYEVFVLTGNTPARTADIDYLALTNSLRADVQTLHQMARDGGPVERVPSLQEYLAGLKSGQIVPVEPGK